MSMYIIEIGRMLALPHGAALTAPIACSPPVFTTALPGQERREMLRDADRPHPRSAAAVRDAERLVQVQVAHVGADVAGPAEADHCVHVGAVQIDLAAVRVHDRADRP